MIHQMLMVALVLALLVAVMAGLKWYQTRFAPHPEIVRKILHVSVGSISLAFPWMFHEVWPVAALAAISAIAFSLLKRSHCSAQNMRNVLCGVNRKSYGEICYPAAVAIVFIWFHSNPLLYSIPILILTFSDALAALVGVFFGRVYFSTKEGHKTLEGSFAFFCSAALCTYIPLMLSSAAAANESLFLALFVGALVTTSEAIAWYGLDNLFIPLSAAACLQFYQHADLVTLHTCLAVALVMIALSFMWRRRTTLDDSAVIAAAVSAYVTWDVGGWAWTIAPLTLLISYKWFIPRFYWRKVRKHSIYQVAAVTSIGFAWLLADKVFGHGNFLFPYTLTYAAHFVVISTGHLKHRLSSSRSVRELLIASVIVWTMMFLPLLVRTPSLMTLLQSCVSLPMIFAVALTFYVVPLDAELSSWRRWCQQWTLAACCSLAGLAAAGL